jgi:serine/threonine protein kinase
VDGIEREIKVHSKCVHPNIVKLYDSFQERESVYIVLEYLSNGNLYNYIQKKKKLDDREACRYFIHTCNALEYLH